MTRPTHALINWSNYRHNYGVAKQLVDGQAYAVVKADGYGHGLVACASALSEADGFAVACVDEALALRKAGIQRPILVLQGAYDVEEWQLASEHQLKLVLHHQQQLEDAAAAKLRQPVSLFLKINSGMNRVGFFLEEVDAVLKRAEQIGLLEFELVMTHFAGADETTEDSLHRQLNYMAQRAWHLPFSLCNSAALFRTRKAGDEILTDAISRPGIMLYGSSPLQDKTASELGLKPVMSLRSQLISTHLVAQGQGVGYGGDWCAPRDSHIGVVAIGYGDGYPRHAPSGTPIWVDGKICPLVGRVSMDMITVDLTEHPDAQIGSPVELWGEHIDVDEIAKLCGTISYELFCQLTPRVKRVAAEVI